MVNWKTIAIVFIVLFGLLLSYNIWAVSYVLGEGDKTNECYYDICSDTPDAWYEEGVCTCYDDNDEIVRTKYMK